MKIIIKFFEKLRILLKDYPEYTIHNGIKVRYTGRYSVNNEDALKANWEVMKAISEPLRKETPIIHTFFFPIYEWPKNPKSTTGTVFGYTGYNDDQMLFACEEKAVGFFTMSGSVPTKEEYKSEKS